MHQALENIWKRRGKKVPVNDERSIALIMFGGAMVGIRGAGAGIALEELGLSKAFDKIYSISAGFGNASFMLSGQARLGTSIYYEDLAKGKFVNFFRFWKILDIDHMVHVTQTKKYFDAQKMLLESQTQLYVCLQNIDKKRHEFLEVHNYSASDYPTLLRAATSVPYFHPGATKIGQYRYEDLPWKNEVYANFVNDAINHSNATDVLVLYNYDGQVIYQNPDPSRIFELKPPANWPLNRLEMNPECLKAECLKMGKFVKERFGVNDDIDLTYEPINANRN